MKKKTIIQLVITFTLLQGFYQVVMFIHPDLSEQTNNSIVVFIMTCLALIWFSRGLWKDTTEEFLETMNRGNMQYFMSILSAIVWFVMGFKFYQDFNGTTVYEQNVFLVILMVLSFAISIDIWFRMAYTRLIFLYIQLKEMNQS